MTPQVSTLQTGQYGSDKPGRSTGGRRDQRSTDGATEGNALSLASIIQRFRPLLPKLKRRYEVDESNWLVIKGRAFLAWLDTDASTHSHESGSKGKIILRWTSFRAVSLGRHAYRGAASGAVMTKSWLGFHWPKFATSARSNLRRLGLTLRWRRVPGKWEMDFIDRMKAAESMGVPFLDVLRDTLPAIMGVEGTRVLGYWAGKKSMLDPEAFVREMSKMFGNSSKYVVMGVFKRVDEGKILARMAPEEPKYQSLVDAISKADERKAMLQEMRVRRTTAIVPIRGPPSS